ncbi:MAG: sulfur carrier protein ThiS [Opitutales bacterium]|nr:sulfur carrier protein ThiS [Opitutales bacterium]MCH8540800.1 sulfur carrier protein ThiS [Opitutales bacterium]
MTIYANDKPFNPKDQVTLPEFLANLGYTPGQVVVELNGQALTPGELKETRLADQDRLEVVQIVAGG